jgi:hypothetical protein
LQIERNTENSFGTYREIIMNDRKISPICILLSENGRVSLLVVQESHRGRVFQLVK